MGAWIGAIGFVIAVVVAVGAIAAFYGKARGKEVIELQEKEISTLRGRVETLEALTTRQGTKLTENDVALRVLTERVTQSAKVDMLALTNETQHQAIMARLDQILAHVGVT